jgi:hypothetical protein
MKTISSIVQILAGFDFCIDLSINITLTMDMITMEGVTMIAIDTNLE